FDGFSIRGTVMHKERGYVRTNPLGGAVFTFPQPTGVVTTASGYNDIDENGGMLAGRYNGIDDLTIDFKADYSVSFAGGNGTQNLGFSSADLTSSTTSFFALAAQGAFGPVGPYVLPAVGSGVAQSSLPNWFAGDNGSDKAWGFNATVQYDIYDNLTFKSI